VVSLDLIVSTDHNRGFHHRLIGVYAPWNPVGTFEDENIFWPVVSNLCNSSTYSWSLHGDFNASLLATKSSSVSLDLTPSWIAYTNFLISTDGINLWQTQPECDVTRRYTHPTRQTSAGQNPISSIIDRSAVSRVGTLAESVSTLSESESL
jgi:hypothetical protein